MFWSCYLKYKKLFSPEITCRRLLGGGSSWMPVNSPGISLLIGPGTPSGVSSPDTGNELWGGRRKESSWRPAEAPGGTPNLVRTGEETRRGIRRGNQKRVVTTHHQTRLCSSSHLRVGTGTVSSLGRLCLGNGASVWGKPLCCSPGKGPVNRGAPAGYPTAPAGLTVPG